MVWAAAPPVGQTAAADAPLGHSWATVAVLGQIRAAVAPAGNSPSPDDVLLLERLLWLLLLTLVLVL